MRFFFYYVIFTFVFLSLMWFVIEKGKTLKPHDNIFSTQIAINKYLDKSVPFKINSNVSVTDQFIHNMKNPLSMLLIQVVLILLISRMFGVLFSKFGQPIVIGEIVSGIILGPSILGFISPNIFNFIFPKESLMSLQYLSQIGLTFFMFSIGMDLDLSKIKRKAKVALVVSHSSIIFPYFLGVCLAYFIYPVFAIGNVNFLSFALFIGIAMSITAFPVLARIIQERGLTRTTLGSLAITCAATDDISAWFILAAVIAIVKAGNITSALFTIGLTIVYVFFMFKVIKPWISKRSQKHLNENILSKSVVAKSFIILLLSACIAELIGIHALFGAFISGVIMPQNINFKNNLLVKIEDISVLILLPIFFAFTGLRTQIGLLNTSNAWLICGCVFLIAVIGKIAGSTLSARFVGLSWKNSLSLGALMNTRGLMELVVLNIGYDLGILSPEIFAIMILMALGTTFMTGPLLNLINWAFPKIEVDEDEIITQ